MTLEELQEQILKLQENQETLNSANAQLQKDLEEKTKRVSELEEHNQKLFLRITTNTIQEEKKDNTEEELKEYLGEKVFEVLSKKDINKAKLIMEGEDE